jgi:hypothetical protein
MLGVPGKLGKNSVHGCQKNKLKKRISLSRSCPNNERPNFGLKEF